MESRPFIEIDHFKKFKQNQKVSGDTFISRKIKDDQRIISVLSDGLGSGVKANVLSTLTATMAMNYVSNNLDIIKTASVIMKTLPVCSSRKISYSTFSIIDIDENNSIRIIEYDNPAFVLIKNGKVYNVDREKINFQNHKEEAKYMYYSQFKAEMGDRIVFFSDGVSQSGIGTESFPYGWGEENAGRFIAERVREKYSLSAKELAQMVVNRAYANNSYRALDDITCGVIHFRKPRKTMVMSGPPINQAKDREMARIIDKYNGNKIICGGTTANIISRELGRSIAVDLYSTDGEIPPTSTMEGVDLITEGTLTLGRVIEIFEKDLNPENLPQNSATKLANMILNSDIINFVVGTKINDAHQDPNVPVELEIRRNIFKKIINLLETKYLKETTLKFI